MQSIINNSLKTCTQTDISNNLADKTLSLSLSCLYISLNILQTGSDKFSISFNKLFKVKYIIVRLSNEFLELFFCSINYRVRVPLICLRPGRRPRLIKQLGNFVKLNLIQYKPLISILINPPEAANISSNTHFISSARLTYQN